jgi:hypothetical protein
LLRFETRRHLCFSFHFFLLFSLKVTMHESSSPHCVSRTSVLVSGLWPSGQDQVTDCLHKV